MCDFFSAVIRRDGKIYHLPSNSHSGIVAHYKLKENDTMSEMRNQPRFYEFEWSGQGAFPTRIESILRGSSPPKLVTDAASVLAKNLKRALDEPGWGLTGDGFFAGEEYADLRWKALINDACTHDIANEIAIRPLHSQGETIKSLHPLVTQIDGEKGFVVADGYYITAPALVEVTGYVYVNENATFTAPALTKTGSVDVKANATFTAPALTKTGYVYVNENATFTAPALVEVTGYVYVNENATFTAPALVEVTGSVYVHSKCKFDAPKLNRKK